MSKAEQSTLLDFEAMFQAHVDENQKQWDHDRASTMGASEAFACLRQTWFKKKGEKHGFEKDADSESSWGAMERGNLIEDHWVVPVLRSQLPAKVELDFEGDKQVTFVYGQNSATPDGLYFNLTRDALAKYGIPDIESDCVLIEVKSIDPRTTLTEEKEIHHGQAQVQMGIIRAMADQGIHKHYPNYCVILYIDASFLDKISVYVVKFDENVFKAARKRAKRVFEVEDAALMPPEGKLKETCAFCEWKHACAKVSQEEVPTKDNNNSLDIQELEELKELAQLEREAAADEKEAETRKKQLREDIKAILRDANTKKAKDDTFSISWVWQKGKTSLDTEAMIADGIDLESYKKTGDGFEKMTISVKE